MTTPLSDRERELARHALGLDGIRSQSYRNRFFCGPGHPDYRDWVAMMERGDADRGGEPFGFFLTRQGAEKALLPGESLDPEDFPPET